MGEQSAPHGSVGNWVGWLCSPVSALSKTDRRWSPSTDLRVQRCLLSFLFLEAGKHIPLINPEAAALHKQLLTCSKFDVSYSKYWGFPGGSAVKNPSAIAGDAGSSSESGRSPGEGNGNPLQYSCLGNPTDRGAWWATVHGVSKSWTRLSN